MQKPENYAKILMECDKIGNINKLRAVRSKIIFQSTKIKPTTLGGAVKNYKLLIQNKPTFQTLLILSETFGPLNSKDTRENFVDIEISKIFDRIKNDKEMKNIVYKILGLSNRVRIENLIHKIKKYEIFKKTATYHKIYTQLLKNNIRPDGYGDLLIYNTPPSTYHLSDKAKKILNMSDL